MSATGFSGLVQVAVCFISRKLCCNAARMSYLLPLRSVNSLNDLRTDSIQKRWGFLTAHITVVIFALASLTGKKLKMNIYSEDTTTYNATGQ